MKGISISELHFVGENERGKTFEFSNPKTGTQVLGLRKAGSANGRHYHCGRSDTKNPEIFILLQGQIKLNARNLKNDETLSTELEAPVQLVIDAFVWHEVIALTDIVFIELNSIEEHAADTEYDIVKARELIRSSDEK